MAIFLQAAALSSVSLMILLQTVSLKAACSSERDNFPELCQHDTLSVKISHV